MILSLPGLRYYQKFGLHRDPFPPGPSVEKVFLTHDTLHSLDQIKHAIDDSEQLVVVAAAAGAGKSVLSRYLEYIKSSRWFVGHVQAGHELNRETLAAEIIRQHFPERKFSGIHAARQLREFLHIFARNGRLPVVIIDDAHQLSPDALRFVLEMSAYCYQGARYRFVLFGDMDIHKRLDDPNLQDLKPASWHSFSVPPLSLQQTRKYLEYRLSLSGECREDPFTDDRILEIYTDSGGLPGAMHEPARRIMQAHQPEDGKRRFLIHAGLTATLGLMVFTAVYSAMNEDYQEKSEQLAALRDRQLQVVPVDLPGTGTLIRPASDIPLTPETTGDVTIARGADKEKPAATGRRSESLLARLFRREDGNNTETGMPGQGHSHRQPASPPQAVASLGNHLSLRLSDLSLQ